MGMIGNLFGTGLITLFAATDGGNASWSQRLESLAQSLGGWGSRIMLILGIASLIVAAYQIVSGLISHGKKQTNWLIVIALLIVGGIFTTVGLSDFRSLTYNQDVENILNGSGADGADSNWTANGGTGGTIISLQ